jgi:transketolase
MKVSKIENLCINSIRVLSADAIEKAKSGHPGLPLGSAAMAFTLWSRHMRHNSADPKWLDRDRFVLSAGHGSMLMYSLLHLFGYGLTVDDLKQFRQLGSKTPGHPEYMHTIGVETTTGPLGQGISNAVGFAIAEAHLAAKFNRDGLNVVDHYTYALVGDGCLMEGISGEASSLAGTLQLGKLIVLYDDNDISIEGNTDISFRENVGMRYEAYGWQVQKVEDGNDVEAISAALAAAKACKDKPSIIIVKTQIGFGCPAKQGKASAHGEPLGADNVKCLKENLGWPVDKDFYVPAEVYTQMETIKKAGQAAEDSWNRLFADWSASYPELAQEWDQWFNGKLPENLLDDPEFMKFEKPDATRNSSGTALNRLAAMLPNLIGGSADLAPSNKTEMKGKGDFSAENYSGCNMHFGVREHAMAAIGNGIALHGGLHAYVATFFVFSDYLKHSMRLSAIMKLPLVYVLTHDSIGVGEDGPTHQPIEQLASIRSIPDFTLFRPADARETAAAWYYGITANGPTAMALTRQNLPLYEGSGKAALQGAYILKEASKPVPDILLLASGSEVELIYKAADILEAQGIAARVVSMPSWELFNRQCDCYKEKVLPKAVRARLAVEAGNDFGWHRYIGLDGDILCMEGYGASGPADQVFKKFGFTVENVVEKALKLLGK